MHMSLNNFRIKLKMVYLKSAPSAVQSLNNTTFGFIPTAANVQMFFSKYFNEVMEELLSAELRAGSKKFCLLNSFNLGHITQGEITFY